MNEQTIAAAELRVFIERIERVERIESEVSDLNADKSEVYKELKGQGWGAKAIKKIIAARRLDSHVREEQDAMFALYWDALNSGPHAYARTHVENTEQFPPSSTNSSQAVDETGRDESSPRVTATYSSEAV